MPTVRTGDVETYYEERGEGPVVVFVHGMFTNASQWEPQVEALSDDWRTVAYDVRGHGRTGGSDREPYSMALFADDLAALLDGLGVEETVVCGLSMGGAVAQTFAVRSPERVRGLVLADTFTGGERSLGGRLLAATVRVLARLDRLVSYWTLNRLQLRVGNLIAPGVAGDPAAIQRVVETGPRITHAELVKIADATAAFATADLALAAVDAPTLLLEGEHLLGGMRAMQDRVAELLGDAVVDRRTVPGGGHASNLDNPAFFTDAVEEFLADVYGSGSDRGAAPGGDGEKREP